MNKKVIFFGVIIVGIVAIIIAAPRIKERKMYRKAVESDELFFCEEYLSRYPNGKHLDEVMDKKETIMYEQAMRNDDESFGNTYVNEFPNGKHLEEVLYHNIGCAEFPLSAINEYLLKFPSGKHADSVNAAYERLWDAEIEKYNRRDRKNESEKAVKYMTEMLQYMKANHVNDIQVNVNSTLDLKDYSEYSYSIRSALEREYDRGSLPLNESNMVSLKDNFQQGDVNSLKEILIEGVQRSMDRMFTPGFIVVKAESLNCPQLTFNYTIKSQENHGVPEIWTYSEKSPYAFYATPKKYLMGITVNCNANFTIPNSPVTYSYSEKGVPEDNINGIQNISDGYRRMTQMCFKQFSNKMSQNMGLQETY